MSDYGFDTLAIHAGQEPDPLTGAVTVPIYQTSTYKQDGVGGLRGGYEYSRSANPTRTALEQALAALEGGARGLAFASGLAAEDALLRTVCRPGDHVILPGDAYGGTFRLVARVLAELGPRVHAGAARPTWTRCGRRSGRTRGWSGARRRPTRCSASPTSPRSPRWRTTPAPCSSSTTPSPRPYLQQPLALGADVVVHSTTKYLGGHSDVVGGALVAADAELGQQLAFHQNAMGAVGRAVRRVAGAARHQDPGRADGPALRNAERVVELLAAHPARRRRVLPGAARSTPDTTIAARQMRGFGGMVSFQLRGGEEAALKVCELVQLFTLGESLGGVESLIEHPAG